MKIAQVYSHLNGQEHILFHKPKLWQEIETVIKQVDAKACKTKISKEKTMPGAALYSPVEMNNRFKAALNALHWHEARTSYWVTGDAKLIRMTIGMNAAAQKAEIENAGQKPLSSFNQTDFVKDRVAIEIQFGKYAFVAFDMFVKHMAFFVGDQIDVGIEVLPMKTLCDQMSSGVPYYERSLYDLIRQGRGSPAVPLVVIGIEP
jgi:hypothetical protein